MKRYLLLFLVGAMISCSSPEPTAQEIVNQAIQVSGTNKLSKASAWFTFRGISYEYFSADGRYTYTRIQADSSNNVIKDVLTNEGLKRFINQTEVALTPEKQAAYTSSVNSVIYFAFLPYHLNDAAVNKSYEGTSEINGISYHKIKITFDAEGGGEDFEDIFYYWFDTQDYSMDYLAYSYNEEDEGRGIRFRVAYNSRKISGITIQDYKNLKPEVKDSIRLEQMDVAYMKGKLEELSLIELEDVVISTP